MSERDKREKDAIEPLPQATQLPAYKRYASHCDEEEAIAPLWLITFTDVMALMLTFFVLLYSMAMPEVEKWSELTAAVNRNFGKSYAPVFNEGSRESISIDKISTTRALDLGYLESVVRGAIGGNEWSKDLVIFPQKDRLVVSMPNDLFFESGSADVQTDGKKILFEIGGVLQRIQNAVEIVGHADPRPIENPQSAFKDNWDLSLARAMSVSAVLENVGYTKPHITRAMASARYADLPEDMEESKKLALSRRVDIVILNSKTPGNSFFGMKL
ncbi:MAG: flagellar motor protein MotB [Alphaproteobacteria bacterium]